MQSVKERDPALFKRLMASCATAACLIFATAPAMAAHQDPAPDATRQNDNLLNQVKRLGQSENRGHFSAKEAQSIYIRGVGYTSPQDERPVLGTRGMGSCVAVAIYNPATKKGALAHFDTKTDLISLDAMMNKTGAQSGPVVVHLAGGNEQSRDLVANIIDTIGQYKHASIKSASIVNPEGALKSLALDTRTGEIFTEFLSSQLYTGPDRMTLMRRHVSEADTVSPLRTEYDHGKMPTLPPAIPLSKNDIYYDFKLGVESVAQGPVHYFDRSGFDVDTVLSLHQRTKDAFYGGKSMSAQDIALIASTFDSFKNALQKEKPGYFDDLENDQAIKIFDIIKEKDASVIPYESRGEYHVIVNLPSLDLNNQPVLERFGLTEIFDKDHLRSVPVSPQEYSRHAGRHEGAHYNQYKKFFKAEEPTRDIPSWKAQADHEAKEAALTPESRAASLVFGYIRALHTGINPDDKHGGNNLIDRNPSDHLLDDHKQALSTLRIQMATMVSAVSGLSQRDTQRLQFDDPQRFAGSLKKAIDAGHQPYAPAIAVPDRITMAAARLGITHDEFAEPRSVAEAVERINTYSNLQNEGAFKSGPVNPHLMPLMHEYIHAVRFLFKKDTPPPKTQGASPDARAETPDVSSEDLVKFLTDDQKQKLARLSLYETMDRAVAEHLNLTQTAALKLRNGNAEQEDRYFNALESRLNTNSIQATVPLEGNARKKETQKLLGLSAKAIDHMQNTDPFLYEIAQQLLYNAGALQVPYDNPFVLQEIRKQISEYQNDVGKSAGQEIKSQPLSPPAPG